MKALLRLLYILNVPGVWACQRCMDLYGSPASVMSHQPTCQRRIPL
jgi:hypothetical protein